MEHGNKAEKGGRPRRQIYGGFLNKSNTDTIATETTAGHFPFVYAPFIYPSIYSIPDSSR